MEFTPPFPPHLDPNYSGNKTGTEAYSEEILNQMTTSERTRLAVKLYKKREIEIHDAIKISGLSAEIFASVLKGMNLEVRQMNVLVCGGAGFIGSNFVRHMVTKYPHYKIVNIDKLTYAGNIDNLIDIEDRPNYVFYQGDIVDQKFIDEIIIKEKIDSIVNFAAETHVDRSIHIGSREFVMTNTVGVQTLLDATRRHNLFKFVNISTDEVYGSLELGEQRMFTEETAFEPNVPYAAAKAGGDMLCRAYYNTFGVPVIVSHCSNNYGPYQFPEKLIPYLITKALNREQFPIYGDGKYIRDWLFVLDHVKAIDLMLHKGIAGEVYNIGGNNEKSNLEIAKLILQYFGLPESMIKFVPDRPGHDRRYAIDATKIMNELGWYPEHRFEEAIPKTIEWYLHNQEWMAKIKQRNENINDHIK
ncbi:MAG: dTDP-glucose 4,6-dehydratase [Candidatus Doudnabacteria bacterium Gr01-1014_77]|uniref:dTDP-glucose 4,6-dehydratase n=1 Tax=Candidatus Doudnabacteria bacterium Gr01-1014_77 TaxID=2017133 RepID=A0A554JCP0_9BACT|nr:MAG: dTDP-glucose 4,6-dehydratase [Candidatus Doudnabacteria bacterium Gr01-1014_77]